MPELRLLTIGEMARKKGLHVYSLEGEMVSTCREDRPPQEFVEESLARTGISFRREDGEYACSHGENDSALVVEWIGAGAKVVLCRRCHPPKGSLPTFLGTRMVIPRPEDSFNLYVRARVRCSRETCSFADDQPLEGPSTRDYISGKIGEEEFLKREKEKIVGEVAAEKGIFVAGNECCEDDYDAFLGALNVPRDLMSAFMELHGELTQGMVLPEASTVKFVEALNRDQQLLLLRAILEDEEMAKALLEASEAEDRSADDILAEALKIHRDMTVVSKLPAWERLPPVANLADSVARSYKTKGREEAALTAGKGLAGGTPQKVLALALLQALESAAGKQWMFREEELQLANFLTPMAKELLKAEGDAYGEGLQRLLTASGSGEVLPKK